MKAKLETSRRALGLVEMMVAMMVLMVALPPLIDAAVSLARWDRTRDLRSHATHFGQLALERTHYQLYDGDPRTYPLTADRARRLAGYAERPPRWQQELGFAQGAVLNAPAKTGGVPAARPFADLFRREDAATAGLTEATHPHVVADVPSYRVQQIITPIDGSTLPTLATKRPEDPRPDLVQVETIVRWTDFRGGARESRVRTWRTRAVWEPDPRLRRDGGL